MLISDGNRNLFYWEEIGMKIPEMNNSVGYTWGYDCKLLNGSVGY